MSGVHVVAVVPPPVTGMTLITVEMFEHFERKGEAKLHKIQKPPKLNGWRWSIFKHLSIRNGLRSALTNCPDIIYYVPDSGKGLWFNLFLHAKLLSTSPRVIMHHHVYSYVRTYNRAFHYFIRKIEQNGTHITHVVLAPMMSEQLRELYCLNDIRVLGNTQFVKQNDIGIRSETAKTFCVGYLSNITNAKGIDVFMDTIRISGLAAVIAGPIENAELYAEVMSFVAEDPEQRQFIGAVYAQKKSSFFANIDVLVFPSRYVNEAQPLTIFEALAAGVPVLATPQGAIVDQLKGTDWVINHADFAVIAASYLTLWSENLQLHREACTQAQHLWKKTYESDNKALQDLLCNL